MVCLFINVVHSLSEKWGCSVPLLNHGFLLDKKRIQWWSVWLKLAILYHGFGQFGGSLVRVLLKIALQRLRLLLLLHIIIFVIVARSFRYSLQKPSSLLFCAGLVEILLLFVVLVALFIIYS